MRSFVQLAHSAVLWPRSLCTTSASGSNGGLVVTRSSNAVGPPSTPGTNSPLAVPFPQHQPRQQHPLVGEAVFQGSGPRGCLSTLGPLSLRLPHFRTGRRHTTLCRATGRVMNMQSKLLLMSSPSVWKGPRGLGSGTQELSSCHCCLCLCSLLCIWIHSAAEDKDSPPSSVVIPVTTVYCGSSPALRLAHFVLGTLGFSSLCDQRQHYTSSIGLPVKVTLQIYPCKVKSR